MLFQVFLSLCLLLVQSVRCDSQAEDNAIFKYLNVQPDTVEKHDIAYMQLNDSQANEVKLGFRVFGYDNNVWLHPVDSYLFTDETLIYKARTVGYKVEFIALDYVISRLGELFADKDHLASFVIGSNDQGSTINGHIQFRGDNLMIRSLPNDVAKQYLRKRRSAETPFEPHPNMAYHVAIKLKEPLNNQAPYAPPVKTGRSAALMQPVEIDHGSIYPDTTNDTLYPEILLYVDHTFSEDWYRRVLTFMEYLMAFWNGVDLIYRNIEVPRIRLHIAAVVLCLDSSATPYLHYNKTSRRINSVLSLEDAAIHFYEYPKFFDRNWDIAVTMTKWSLGYSINRNEILGRAFVDSVCEITEKNFKRGFMEVKANAAMAQALIHDNGAFYGIPVAAHELAHVLGVNHDNETVYPECNNKNGFLMGSIIATTRNGHSLSVCSLYTIQRAQRTTDNYRCLYNKPYREGTVKLPSLMPGKIASWDKQCQALGYENGACRSYRGFDICVQLWCETRDNRCQPFDISAADGTPCPNPDSRNQGFCLQNTCSFIN